MCVLEKLAISFQQQSFKCEQIIARQPTDQARHFSLFDHSAQMPDKTDAKILTASPLVNWKRPPGRPCTTWMKTIQQE